MSLHNDSKADIWAAGDAYEPYVGRWSRSVAREFLQWLAVPGDRSWLDVGCGTGALSQTILAITLPRQVTMIDRSQGYITYARERAIQDSLRFNVADAQTLPFPANRFDAVVSGLVLNFVPEPPRAVSEMARVTRPGGTVAL